MSREPTLPLDVRTLRWAARLLRRTGDGLREQRYPVYASGYEDAGKDLLMRARAIEKRKAKPAGKRKL